MPETVEERLDGPGERESTDEWLARVKRMIAEGQQRSIEMREAERRHRELIWLVLLANGYFVAPPRGMLDLRRPMD